MQTSPQRKPALWPLVLALQDLLIHRPKQDFYLINPNIIESQSQTTPTNTTETSDSLSRDGELGVAGITGAALVQEGASKFVADGALARSILVYVSRGLRTNF